MDFGHGITLLEVDNGLLIQQYDQGYIARKWQLSDAIIEMVKSALDSGLIWMIREGHPQVHSRWPSKQGRAYMAFSPTPEDQWSLAIDTVRKNGSDFGKAVFNGKYHEQFLRTCVPFTFEKRNLGSGHMEVARPEVIPTIRKLADFDHSVLQLGRFEETSIGFATEYDIQRSMLISWSDTPFAGRSRLVGAEIHLDLGRNSRRIDILARDEKSNDWIVIELKRAEASLDALAQVQDYVLSLAKIEGYSEGGVIGVLIAERVPNIVRIAAQEAGIAAYEIQFPFKFSRVA